MAEITKLRKQYLSEIGHGVDAALEPVDNYSGLTGVTTTARYIGMEKIVLNNGSNRAYPMRFFLSGSTRNAGWKIKEIFPVPTHEALDNLVTFTVGLGLPITKFTKGLEVTVVADEKNESKPTKYRITTVDTTAKTVTWERCDSATITVEGTDMESAGV